MNHIHIISKFARPQYLIPHGNGHINDTYVTNRFIVQRINTEIFKEPEKLMENILNVTDFLREKISASGGNPARETLQVIPTISGESFYRDTEGNCYRAYDFIENTVSYDIVSAPLLYSAAKTFGKFQNMLNDYPAHTLHETIPDFHNTYKRFLNLKRAVSANSCGKLDSVHDEVSFAFERENDTHIIIDATEKGEIPLRVTHNDTKLNNVLFDASTNEGLCVIDLDTVMPGSLLYDYGDALRFGGASGAEDEKDLSKIYFELDKFEAFTKGFLEEVGSKLTPKEAELLPFSVKLMTFECGIRFLTDYLEGDTYFKTHYKEHNLDRARTQFKLVADIENKIPEMKAIVKKHLTK